MEESFSEKKKKFTEQIEENITEVIFFPFRFWCVNKCFETKSKRKKKKRELTGLWMVVV